MKFTKLMPILVATMAASLFAQRASAQDQSEPPITVTDAFERALYNKSGNLYDNASIWRQFNLIFGVGSFPTGSFPDNEDRRDGENLEELYQELMHQQVSSDPIIRTRDLKNPYSSSVLTNPEYISP